MPFSTTAVFIRYEIGLVEISISSETSCLVETSGRVERTWSFTRINKCARLVRRSLRDSNRKAAAAAEGERQRAAGPDPSRAEQLPGVLVDDEQHGGRGHAPDERGRQAAVERGQALVAEHAHHAHRPAARRQRVVQLYARLDHVHRERDRPQQHAARRARRRGGQQAALGPRPAGRLQRLADRLVHAEEAEVAGHLAGHRHGQPAEQAGHAAVAHDVLRKRKRISLDS